MDQPSRQRPRGIRTIGRLSVPPPDDVLLAQWPASLPLYAQRQDVAIASDWRQAGRASGSPMALGGPAKAEPGSFDLLADQYEAHQQRAVQRLLDAIDAALATSETRLPAFEPPPVPLETVLSAIEQAVSLGMLGTEPAEQLRQRIVHLGESVTRLWALVDLYRAGHLTQAELLHKRDILLATLDPK